MWSNFSRSSQCEQEFPSAIEKRINLFQQVLLVQAARPDRLQSAMSQFACRALGKVLLTLYYIPISHREENQSLPTSITGTGCQTRQATECYEPVCLKSARLNYMYYYSFTMFPSAVEKRINLFQQVLLVQAARPNRLQSAMGQFACRALGKTIINLLCSHQP